MLGMYVPILIDVYCHLLSVGGLSLCAYSHQVNVLRSTHTQEKEVVAITRDYAIN